MSEALGHVIIAKDRPASPFEFWCTVEVGHPNLQVGSYVIVSGDGKNILGIVEDIQHSSQIDSSSHYYAEMAKRTISGSTTVSPTIERYAKIRVLSREPPFNVPPDDRWKVRLLKADDEEMLNKKIPRDNRILCGFIRGETWVPIYVHSEFLLGPEAAHANITGKTGLATKTSYAVFLAYCALSWAKNKQEPTAVLMLNVKRGDLMRLHNLPENWDDALDKIRIWAEAAGMQDKASEMVAMWNIAKELGVDPFNIEIKYFDYQGDPFQPTDFKHLQLYSYGLRDMTIEELIAALYSPEEQVPEPQINMIYTYMEAVSDREITFNQMLRHLSQYSRYTPDEAQRARQRGLFTAPDLDNWHKDTAGALYRRLLGFLNRSTRIVRGESAHGYPITFDAIEPYKIHVVQIFGLSSSEKRLVVNAIMRQISEGLARREKVVNRVLVFIDELNQYAPRTPSPVKEQIIEIVSRGRDLQLSLLGAQQFASQIDVQVYGNFTTKIVGNSDEAEIRQERYRYLGHFRKVAPILEKGDLIIYHPMHISPLLINFPVPLHETVRGY